MVYIWEIIRYLLKATSPEIQEYQKYCEAAASTHQDSSYVVWEYFSQDGEWRCHGSSKANGIHWANDKAENDELCPSLGSVQQAAREKQEGPVLWRQTSNPNTQLIFIIAGECLVCSQSYGKHTASLNSFVYHSVPYVFLEWSKAHRWTSFPTFICGAILLCKTKRVCCLVDCQIPVRVEKEHIKSWMHDLSRYTTL